MTTPVRKCNFSFLFLLLLCSVPRLPSPQFSKASLLLVHFYPKGAALWGPSLIIIIVIIINNNNISNNRKDLLLHFPFGAGSGLEVCLACLPLSGCGSPWLLSAKGLYQIKKETTRKYLSLEARDKTTGQVSMVVPQKNEAPFDTATPLLGIWTEHHGLEPMLVYTCS